ERRLARLRHRRSTRALDAPHRFGSPPRDGSCRGRRRQSRNRERLTMLGQTRTKPASETSGVAEVSVVNVSKVFGHGPGAVVALDHVDLDVHSGEFVCLLGASGCGKSTLLNLVAGLDQPTTGSVHVRSARTGLMFQEAALFPWLTVRGNVELALKLNG